MSGKSKPQIIVILGPTASGKTSLSISLAKQFAGEVVNADSRTVYRGMDIGTSKPTETERSVVPHHLFDIVSPDERFTLADWQTLAFNTVDTIIEHSAVPFIVGGTGLYISALIDNYDIPSGRKEPKYDALIIGLDVPREELYKRIDRRVLEMVHDGLEDEVRELTKKYDWSLSSMSGIGYQEWKTYLEKKSDIATVTKEIQQATRNYAKRQMTWFRGMERAGHTIHWVTSLDDAASLVDSFLKR